MNTNKHFLSYLVQFFFRVTNFSDRIFRKIQNVNFMFKNIFFSRILPFMR